MNNLEDLIKPFDTRREIVILDSLDQTVEFTVHYWLKHAKETLKHAEFFHVALSGGSTPSAVYKQLASASYRNEIDWKRVKLFWSDERLVPHDHPDSNYKMAMDAGLKELSIPQEHVFPIPTDLKPEENAAAYEKTLKEQVPNCCFDFIMLGMGDDGHTASLFPRTHALDVNHSLIAANYLPDKSIWRLTMTYKSLNTAKKSVILVTGKGKAETCLKVLEGEENFALLPVQKIGTDEHPCLWILDRDAASFIK